MYSFKKFSTIRNDELKGIWQQLQAGCDMTAFQSYEWYCMLEDEFKHNTLKKLFGRVIFYAFYADGKPTLIFPVHFQTRTLKIGQFGYEKGLFFLGMRGYSDYLNMVYEDIHEVDISSVIAQVMSDTKCGFMHLTQIPQTSQLRALLENCDGGFSIRWHDDEVCVQLRLPENMELFLKGMHKQFRQNYRTTKNHYQGDGFALSVELIEGICADERIIERVSEIHKDRFESKNQRNYGVKVSSFLQRLRGQYDEVAYALRTNSQSWLLLGRNEGKIITYTYGLKDDKAIRIMQLGFDREYAERSPNTTMLIDYIINHYAQLSGTVIDFTRGQEAYKYRIGGTEHLICSITIETKNQKKYTTDV